LVGWKEKRGMSERRGKRGKRNRNQRMLSN
jgi:hypothetical protein